MKLITVTSILLLLAACHTESPEAGEAKFTPKKELIEDAKAEGIEEEILFQGHGLATATSLETEVLDAESRYPDQRFVFRVLRLPGKTDPQAEVRAIDENLRPLRQDDCVDRNLIYTGGRDELEVSSLSYTGGPSPELAVDGVDREKSIHTYEKGEREFVLTIYDSILVASFEYIIPDSDGDLVKYRYEKADGAPPEQEIPNDDYASLMEGDDCEQLAKQENMNGR